MPSASKISVILIAAMGIANRILFLADEYNRLSAERETDQYMAHICDDVDYKKMGRHSAMCSELHQRLSTGTFFHALRSVTDDTINREVTVTGIVTVFTGLSIVMMLSNLQQRYVKFNMDGSLPQHKMKLQ